MKESADEKSYFCGGTVISDSAVATNANCFFKRGRIAEGPTSSDLFSSVPQFNLSISLFISFKRK